jgi:dolichyl-diphosphooligosaccharide--protein glycosyltransferase
MKNSLMYRLCYYRFGEVRTKHDEPSGYDTVRDCEIGLKDFDLKYFRESYTSERWLVRIYEVLPLPMRDNKLASRFAESVPAAIQGTKTATGKLTKKSKI